MSQSESTSGAPRRLWPVRVCRLSEEPGDDLSAESTPEQRLEMVAVVSRRLWELTGQPVPVYPRAAMPVRVLRGA